MDAGEGLIREIDERVAHIHAQAQLGANVDEVAAEEAKALLHTFSEIGPIEFGVVTTVSKHLQTKEVWFPHQLSAFNACLRANATNPLQQPGKRPMKQTPRLHQTPAKGAVVPTPSQWCPPDRSKKIRIGPSPDPMVVGRPRALAGFYKSNRNGTLQRHSVRGKNKCST